MKKILVLLAIVSISLLAQQVDEKYDILELQPSPANTKPIQRYKPTLALDFPEQNAGRSYYDSLIKKASKRHWAFSISVNYIVEDGGFDCNGCSTALSSALFGKDPLTIKDIYLFSKLSDDNKVRITNSVARAPERGGVPIGVTGVVFGGFRDDLYTTLLAPVELVFDADQSEISFITSGMYRFDVGKSDKFSIALGFSLPIKAKKHSIEVTCIGGELFRRAFVPDSTQRETSLKQFFREFIDLPDFIATAILKPKGLELECEQRVAGLGDISVFGLLEYHSDWSIEAGLQVVFPTATKGKGTTLWEPILGNGGAFQFDPFIQVLMATATPYVNPFARLAVEVSSAFTTDKVRVPTLVTNDVRQQVKNVEGLSAPDTFQNFYVDPFSEFDTSVPLFAGKTPCVQKKIGPKILFGLGNYAYKLFHVDLRWGLFYDYYHKAKDSFSNQGVNCDCDETVVIDNCTMEKCSDQTAHTFGTNLTYKFSNMFELGAGGQFTVLGKNVAKNGNFYFSFVVVF